MLKVTIEFEVNDEVLTIVESQKFKLDEQQIRGVLADALHDFVRSRRESGGVSYVERRYPHFTPEQRKEKAQEVWRRQATADALHVSFQDGTFKVLPSTEFKGE